MTASGLLLALAVGTASAAAPTALDSVYLFYADGSTQAAFGLLQRLVPAARGEQKFAVELELGDYYLDKARDYARAESSYERLVAAFPRHRRLPDVLYRLALAQELQEEFLDAARNYEKVATRYAQSRYGTDALDAIERCFRKNYQDRVAYVNGFPITRIELDDRISRNPPAFEAYEKKQALLDTMVDNRLLYEAALAAGVPDDPALGFNLNEQRNRLLFQQWYEREVNTRAEPTDGEVAAAYRRDKATKYTTPERVQAFQLLVDTRATADSLRSLLLADTSTRPAPYPVQGDAAGAVPVSALWDSLVKTRSRAPDRDRGGDLGLFARGVQPQPVEDAAFRLRPGQVSRPVQVEGGYVLLWVVRKTARIVRPLDEVKSQLAAELRQNKTTTVFDEQIALLRASANVVQDSAALAESRETLAVVDGVPVTSALLQERLNAIPPYFRSQFESPEGRKRILDQLILERLLLRETERAKLWLDNRVVDQLLGRQATMFVDTYKRQMTTDKATVDSAAVMADYLANIKDYKEPTRVHCREMVATSQARARQLRRWAVAGRLPAMVAGRAVLATDSAAAVRLRDELALTDNADTLVGAGCLVSPPAGLPGRPQVNLGGRNVPDLSARSDLTGPFVGSEYYGFAFGDLTAEDRLYAPELVTVRDADALTAALGRPEGPASPVADSTRFGTYVRLSQLLPAGFVKSLFGVDSTGAAPLRRVPGGWLALKVTRLDTAQTVEVAELIRRFSSSGSRWSGGDMWLTRDDNSRDARVVRAAYAAAGRRTSLFGRLFGGRGAAYSPVIRLNDSTFTFVKSQELKRAYTRPFSEVRGKIEPRLRREKEGQLYTELIAALRSAADIEVVMKESDFVVEPEPETEPAEPPAPVERE